MSYESLDQLSNIYKNKMAGLITLPTINGQKPPAVKSAVAGTLPTLATAKSNFTNNFGGSVGIKTKSPQDNVKAPDNTTPNPVMTVNLPNNSKDGGTGGGSTQAIPAYGSDVKDTSGKVVGQAMYDPNTGKPLTNPTTTPAPTNTPPTPTYSPTDTGLYGKLVADLANRSQQSGEDYKAAQAEANRVAGERTNLAQDFAQKDANIKGTAGFLTQATGLEGILQGQYNQGNAALSAQEQSATNRLSAANTQQGLLQQVLGTAAGYAQPTQSGPTDVPFNPTTGTYGSPASTAYGAGGLATVGGLLQQQQQGADTQIMIGAYNQAKPLIETAKQQIASAGFNASPLALANQLQQYVNNNIVPSGDYANIFNTLSEIATTISPVLGAQGAQTDLKTMIAQNFIPQLLQGKEISSVFDNIEKNALAKISANKSTATGGALNVPNNGNTGPITWDNFRI